MHRGRDAERPEEEEDRRKTQAPVEQLPGHDAADVVGAVAKGRESLGYFRSEFVDTLGDPRNERRTEEQEQPEEDEARGLVPEHPAIVERGKARAPQDVETRQHVLRERPDDDAARDEHVERGLQQRRRDEGGVRGALDPPLCQEEPDDVAAARRHDGIDAGPGDIGAEHREPRGDSLRIRSPDDVPPGGRDGGELAQVTRDADRKPPEVHRSQVAEEDADRMEDGVDHSAKCPLRPLQGSKGRRR